MSSIELALTTTVGLSLSRKFSCDSFRDELPLGLSGPGFGLSAKSPWWELEELLWVRWRGGRGRYSHMTYEAWLHDICMLNHDLIRQSCYMLHKGSEAHMTWKLVTWWEGLQVLHAHTTIMWHLQTLFWDFWASQIQQILAWRWSVMGKITIYLNSTNPTQPNS